MSYNQVFYLLFSLSDCLTAVKRPRVTRKRGITDSTDTRQEVASLLLMCGPHAAIPSPSPGRCNKVLPPRGDAACQRPKGDRCYLPQTMPFISRASSDRAATLRSQSMCVFTSGGHLHRLPLLHRPPWRLRFLAGLNGRGEDVECSLSSAVFHLSRGFGALDAEAAAYGSAHSEHFNDTMLIRLLAHALHLRT